MRWGVNLRLHIYFECNVDAQKICDTFGVNVALECWYWYRLILMAELLRSKNVVSGWRQWSPAVIHSIHWESVNSKATLTVIPLPSWHLTFNKMILFYGIYWWLLHWINHYWCQPETVSHQTNCWDLLISCHSRMWQCSAAPRTLCRRCRPTFDPTTPCLEPHQLWLELLQQPLAACPSTWRRSQRLWL